MKKRVSIIALMLAVLLLTACAGPEPVEKEVWATKNHYFGVLSDTGYYYLDENGILCFMDASNGVSVCLCPKVGCPHTDSEECEGGIATFTMLATPMFLWQDGFYYANSDLYGTHLYRRNADGTAQRTVATLCQSLMDEWDDANISVDSYDCMVSGHYLYYHATVSAVVRDEVGNANAEPVMEVINRLDLQTGREETLLEDRESRLNLLAAKEDTVLYTTVKLPDASPEENYDEYWKELEQNPVRLMQMTSEETKQLFEKKRKDFYSEAALWGSTLYYYYYDEEGIQHHRAYDLETGVERDVAEGILDIINSRYALHRLTNKDSWSLLDMTTGKMLPCWLGSAPAAVYAGSEEGIILRWRDNSSGSKQYIHSYIPLKALDDGLQREDAMDFYTMVTG